MERFRTLGRPAALLAALGAAVTLGSSAAAAGSVGSDVSSNWAGYVVSAASADTSSGATGGYSSASGDWVQPAARCGASSGPTAAAFWIGLGGDSRSSSGLEQIGTESDCTGSGSARYSAWYELLPANSVRIALKVAPGDQLSASVGVDGTKVTLKLANLTTGRTFSRVLAMAAPDTSSAEWIAEAPSLCASVDGSSCRQAALTNFGKVGFSHSSLTSTSGHSGTISDPAWSATALSLDAASGFGFGRFTAESGAAQAVPGALRGGGASFAVSWTSAAATGPGQASGPGYGGGGPGSGGSPYAV